MEEESIKCPFPGCDWETGKVSADMQLLTMQLHAPAHATATTAAGAASRKQKAPKIDRPKISEGSSEETWNSIISRWNMFTRGTQLTPDEKVQQLFQCCDDHLGNQILRSYPGIVEGDEATLLAAIKTLAVVPVARVVRRTELLTLKQDHGEKTRKFLSRIQGKAMTCAYKKKCTTITCATEIDFTDILVKDILIAGLVSSRIKSTYRPP